jgi:hypothetical protein
MLRCEAMLAKLLSAASRAVPSPRCNHSTLLRETSPTRLAMIVERQTAHGNA